MCWRHIFKTKTKKLGECRYLSIRKSVKYFEKQLFKSGRFLTYKFICFVYNPVDVENGEDDKIESHIKNSICKWKWKQTICLIWSNLLNSCGGQPTKHLEKLNQKDKCFLMCYIFLTGCTIGSWFIKSRKITSWNRWLTKRSIGDILLDSEYVPLYDVENDCDIISIEPKNLSYFLNTVFQGSAYTKKEIKSMLT